MDLQTGSAHRVPVTLCRLSDKRVQKQTVFSNFSTVYQLCVEKMQGEKAVFSAFVGIITTPFLQPESFKDNLFSPFLQFMHFGCPVWNLRAVI